MPQSLPAADVVLVMSANMEATSASRVGRVLRCLGIFVVIALVAGAAGWALKTVVTPPPNVLAAAPYTTAEAVEGTLSQSISLNATASWKKQRSVANQASGMVTSIDTAAGSQVSGGQVLYRVALRPVVAAQGETPAFRDIGSGTRGEDVRQLQQMLTDLGKYDGKVDGNAGWDTAQAIRAWQRDLGIEADGVVHLGDVLFLPSLPATIAYDGITVGQSVSPGSGSVNILGSAPEFTISLSESQARMVAPETPVTLTHGESTWEATVKKVTPATKDTATTATLVSTNDQPICRDECASLPVTSDTTVPATVVVVPEQSGVVVPAAALTRTPDEKTVVVSADGKVIPVTVVASARGSSVVEGVEVGTRVRVPGVLPTPEEAGD